MATIIYKEQHYATRTLQMTAELTGVIIYTIADDTLFNAISREDQQEVAGTVEQVIDAKIDYYVNEGQLTLAATIICQQHLDQVFEFIKEL